jgi:hypothetical protein
MLTKCGDLHQPFVEQSGAIRQMETESHHPPRRDEGYLSQRPSCAGLGRQPMPNPC